MTEAERVRQAAAEIAACIQGRDVSALAGLLAAGFVQRTPGGQARDAGAFLGGIREIPGEIVFVRLVGLEVDVSDAGAIATGIQHARVRIDGTEIDDRRVFVDWFVVQGGAWKLRAAVDVALPPAQQGAGEGR